MYKGGHYIDDCTPTHDQGQSGQGENFELVKRSSKESRVALKRTKPSKCSIGMVNAG